MHGAERTLVDCWKLYIDNSSPRIGDNMRKVKLEPGTIVFKSKKRHVSFAFGMGKRWGINFGAEYYEAWDCHHFVIGFTIIKFFVAFRVNWRIFGEDYDRDEMYLECTTERREYGR